jgi:hypothetical protein
MDLDRVIQCLFFFTTAVTRFIFFVKQTKACSMGFILGDTSAFLDLFFNIAILVDKCITKNTKRRKYRSLYEKTKLDTMILLRIYNYVF